MPEIRISVGGRSYTVACQSGEEAQLKNAAEMLDREAQTMLGAAPKLPEGQLLLMAGLMLADRTSAVDVGVAAQSSGHEAEIAKLKEALQASEARAKALDQKLDANSNESEDGADLALLEKMAVELERLADEMEAANA